MGGVIVGSLALNNLLFCGCGTAFEDGTSKSLDYTAQLKIFPNPVGDQLTILSEFDHSTPPMLYITDSKGALVFSRHLKSNKTSTISMAGLMPGLYYVTISSDSKHVTKTLIKL